MGGHTWEMSEGRMNRDRCWLEYGEREIFKKSLRFPSGLHEWENHLLHTQKSFKIREAKGRLSIHRKTKNSVVNVSLKHL